MFPQPEGRLLVSLHGYCATGSRIIAYATDGGGAPIPSRKAGYAIYARSGKPRTRRPFRSRPAVDGLILTPGWDAAPGVRPAGAPVGLTVATDGALWVAEDCNGTILRFARDTGAPAHLRDVGSRLTKIPHPEAPAQQAAPRRAPQDEELEFVQAKGGSIQWTGGPAPSQRCDAHGFRLRLNPTSATIHLWVAASSMGRSSLRRRPLWGFP
jgi:hypothetical protein